MIPTKSLMIYICTCFVEKKYINEHLNETHIHRCISDKMKENSLKYAHRVSVKDDERKYEKSCLETNIPCRYAVFTIVWRTNKTTVTTSNIRWFFFASRTFVLSVDFWNHNETPKSYQATWRYQIKTNFWQNSNFATISISFWYEFLVNFHLSSCLSLHILCLMLSLNNNHQEFLKWQLLP